MGMCIREYENSQISLKMGLCNREYGNYTIFIEIFDFRENIVTFVEKSWWGIHDFHEKHIFDTENGHV